MATITVDFDGTLYQGNSSLAMIKTGKKELTPKQWYLLIKIFFRMALLKKYKREKDLRIIFMRAFISQMEGKDKNELSSFFKAVIKNDTNDLNTAMISKVNNHLEHKHMGKGWSYCQDPYINF